MSKIPDNIKGLGNLVNIQQNLVKTIEFIKECIDNEDLLSSLEQALEEVDNEVGVRQDRWEEYYGKNWDAGDKDEC